MYSDFSQLVYANAVSTVDHRQVQETMGIRLHVGSHLDDGSGLVRSKCPDFVLLPAAIAFCHDDLFAVEIPRTLIAVVSLLST